MKKTDIAMIVLIASISVLISYFVAKSIFGNVYSASTKVKTIDPISSKIEEPSSEIFNTNAINPAIPVQIKGTTESDTTSGSQ
jgi:hypothetical protein